MKEYNPLDWYWVIAGDETRRFSSASGDYVPVKDATYLAWAADGTQPSRINSEAELGEVLADQRIRPQSAGVLDGFKERHANKTVIEVPAKLWFRMVNDIRKLKGQNALSAAQFKAYIKDQM